MGCHGSFSLDDSTRRSWYDSETILSEVGLRSGMAFADVGCGDGFFSILAAQIVGETGTVFAVDSDSQAIERLKSKATQLNLGNIKAQVGTAEKTVFCKACIDLIFYSMVLHDFEDPVEVLLNAKKMLNASGTLANLDWKKVQMPFGPPYAIRFSEQDAMELMKMAGFNVDRVKEMGPYHYLVITKPDDHCGL